MVALLRNLVHQHPRAKISTLFFPVIWIVALLWKTDQRPMPLPAKAAVAATATPTRPPKPTRTPTSTPTRRPKPTRTPTPTFTPTRTRRPTRTSTPTLTPTPTDTPTPTACVADIEFTYVPPYGSFDDLQGQVSCVAPENYKVAVYIYSYGWWNKPYWDAPLTPIQPDGTWTTDITTGSGDELATQIAAFLVPNGYAPPEMHGEQPLPPELYENAVDYIIVARSPYRTIEFSGYTWNVKQSDSPVGPGPNYFSDNEADVWVDADGRLHLKIVLRDGRWYCSEIYTTAPLGYGTYTFTLASRVDNLDKNVVLGLFTWDDNAPQYHYREIDIEFSRWGDAANQNSQYVVQPWDTPGNIYRFDMTLLGDFSTHSFAWLAESVRFSSYQGHALPPDPGNSIATWLYSGADVPPAGGGNARINLWLMNGAPPSDGQEVEVIIESFEFAP